MEQPNGEHNVILSRRSFVKGGTLLGISLGVPSLLGASSGQRGAVIAQVAQLDTDEPGWSYAPSNLMAVPVGVSQVDLSWTGNWDDATFYQIERSPNGVDTWTIVEGALPVENVTYSDTGLDPDTTYFYRVRAGRVV